MVRQGEKGGLNRHFIDLGEFNGNWRAAFFVSMRARLKHLTSRGQADEMLRDVPGTWGYCLHYFHFLLPPC